MKALMAFLVAGACCCYAYVNSPSHRTDNTNMQFLVNVNSANVNNASGVPWITPGTNVMAAVVAGMKSWESVTTANIHFATPQTTTLDYDSNSSANVISFDSGSEATALLNTAIAVTAVYSDEATGVIAKTDIVFSTTDQFSTTGVATAFDLQSILTHELGHCLGSSHTGVLSGTMFQFTGEGVTDQSHLKPDDIAFASALYPVGKSYGTISGTLTDSTGKNLFGGLISAEDPVSGQIIGGFSSLTDGTYSFAVPEGSYYVWAEPLNGLVKVANVYLTASQVDTNWQPVVAGGVGSPSTFHVTAGQTTIASLSAPVGVSPIEIEFTGGTTTPGTSFEIYSGPTDLPSGQTVYFIFEATGISASATTASFSTVGPVKIVPESFRSLGKSQYQLVLTVPTVSELTTSSLFIMDGSNTATFSAGLEIQPPAPSFPSNGIGNAFSFAGSSVAPGEIVAIFGTNMGPTAGLSGSFTSTGYLTSQVNGISVRFDGIPAPLFYAGAGQINVQVPYEVSGEASTSIVVDTGLASTAVSIPVAAAAPGLFSSAVNADGSPNSASTPASPGAYLVLYATGLGNLSNAIDTGEAAPGADASADAVTVNLGGTSVTPAYAGVTPGLAGLDQINVQIPAGVPSGELSLFVTSAGGAQSQTISVWIQ